MKRLLPLLLAGCTVPIGGVPETPAPATRIEGTLTVEADPGEPLGPAILVRYACDDPPPPAGTGSPQDFLILAEDAFDGGRAEYVFPSVPAGACVLLTGFIDRDRDFHYAFSTAGQATAGDVAIDPVTVVTEELDGDLAAPSLGVDLVARTVVPLERPVFTFRMEGASEPGGGMALGPAVGTTPNTLLRLTTQDLESDLVDASSPRFTVVFAPDTDGDGWPDDNNADGAPDVLWPRVLFFRLDPEDPAGLTRAEPPVLLPGVVLPLDLAAPMDLTTNLVLQSRLAGLPFDGQSLLPVADLRVAVPPLVVTDLATSSVAPLEGVEGDVFGDYQVLVMNSTGQVWNLPNELAGLGVEGQDLRFSVTEAVEPAPVGIIGGVVAVDEPGGDAYVVRFDCANPPPPAGTGSPVALSVVKEELFVGGVGQFSFPNVPAESCSILTGLVDRDGDFSALYGLAQGASAGDLQLDTATVTMGAAVDGLVETEEVALGALGEVPADPPAFVASETTMTLGPATATTPVVTMQLTAAQVDSMFGSYAGGFDLVFAPDGPDADTWAEDDNGDGLPDTLWPRILLVKLDPTDPAGLATADPPVVLPGIPLPLDPTAPLSDTNLAWMQWLGDGFDGVSTIPLDGVTVAVPPLVVTDLAARTTAPIEDVLASGVDVLGDYAIVAMNPTGQVWTLPNEAGVLGDGTQGAMFHVEAGSPPPSATIAGAVRVPQILGDPGGPAYLLRYDCAAPPPPEGSGAPVDFVRVPEEAFVDGMAPFVLTGAPPESCVLLTGFVDRDADFDPLLPTAAGATAGDLVMNAVVGTIGAAGSDGVVQTVVLDLDALGPVPTERPVTTLVNPFGPSDPTMQLNLSEGTATTFFVLAAEDLESGITDAVGELGVVFAPDLDGDGFPDDNNADGLPDALWPRVLMRRLASNDPWGLALDEAGPILPGVIVTADATDPLNPATSLVAAAFASNHPFDGQTPYATESLTIAVPPLVVESLDPLTLGSLDALAASQDVSGRYQVVVISATGQTWSVPNELGVAGVPGQDDVFRVTNPN